MPGGWPESEGEKENVEKTEFDGGVMCVTGRGCLARNTCAEDFFEDARVVREENVSDGVGTLVDWWEEWRAEWRQGWWETLRALG